MVKLTLRNAFIGFLIFFAIIFQVIFPFIFWGGASGGALLGVVSLIFLIGCTVFVYLKVSKWYRSVKPKLGKVGYFLLAINFGCIALVFSSPFILALLLTSLLPYWWTPVTTYPFVPWWGYGIYGWLTNLFFIGVSALFCSFMASLLYLWLQENPLKQQSRIRKALFFLIFALDIFTILFALASINYWYLWPPIVLLALMCSTLVWEYRHFRKKLSFGNKQILTLIAIFLGILGIVGLFAEYSPLLQIVVYLTGDVILASFIIVHWLEKNGNRSEISS